MVGRNSPPNFPTAALDSLSFFTYLDRVILKELFMPGGRPTVYRPEYADNARSACMLGATNDSLAERFEVSVRTIGSWIATIPDFSEAVKQGRHVADEAVVSALFARATGTERKMAKVFLHDGQPVTVSYTVALPPDVRACIFWLRNRRPEQWNEGRRPAKDEEPWDWSELEKPGRPAALADELKEPDATLRDAAERLHVHLRRLIGPRTSSGRGLPRPSPLLIMMRTRRSAPPEDDP
jgi:hypothetical protein